MLSSMWDHKNAMIKNLLQDEKIDPGTFSFMETGWWLLHTADIAGVFYLGSKLTHKSME